MTHEANLLLFFFIFFVIFVTFIVIIVKQTRQYRQTEEFFKNIVEAFNPGEAENITRERWTRKISAATVINGVEYTLSFTPRTKSRNSIIPAHFDISLKCTTNGEFTIREEGAFDRLGKNIGIASEIQTGDASFDKAFYIESENRIFTSNFLGEPAKREAIRALVRIGFTEINLDGENMTACWDDFQAAKDFDAGPLKEAAGHLSSLTEDIPESSIDSLRSTVSASTSNVPPSKLRYGILYGAPFVLTVVLMLFNQSNGVWKMPIDFFPFFLYTLRYSLPAIVFYMIICLRVLPAGSTAHRQLATIFIASIGLFGFAGFHLGIFLNNYQDPGEPKTRTVRIVRKSKSPSKNTRAYSAHLNPWPPRTETVELGIGYEEYQSIITGRTLATVITRPGGLGFEWISAYKFEGPARTPGYLRNLRLRVAAKDGKLDEAKRLLAAGAEVNARSQAGFTALHLAAQFGHAEIVRFLISTGGDINARTKKGWTPLLHAIRKKHPDVFVALLNAGADPKIKNNKGWSPIQMAAWTGDAAMIKRLIEKGADINARTEKRPTAIYYAANKGHTEAAKILLEKGADANLPFGKWTPLAAAEKRGHTEIAALLRKNGAR